MLCVCLCCPFCPSCGKRVRRSGASCNSGPAQAGNAPTRPDTTPPRSCSAKPAPSLAVACSSYHEEAARRRGLSVAPPDQQRILRVTQLGGGGELLRARKRLGFRVSRAAAQAAPLGQSAWPRSSNLRSESGARARGGVLMMRKSSPSRQPLSRLPLRRQWQPTALPVQRSHGQGLSAAGGRRMGPQRLWCPASARACRCLPALQASSTLMARPWACTGALGR